MDNKVTLVELIDCLAEVTSSSKRLCELFLRELFSTVSQELVDGNTVKIKNIGTFKVSLVKSRKSVSIKDGKDIEISGYKRITFTPDKSLAQAVNEPFAQFESVVLDDALTDDKLAAIDEKYNAVSSEPSEPSEPSTPVEEPPVQRKPMLVGIPIDGPSHPVPEPTPVEEPVVDDHFYRPELRDVYSPTQEQLSSAPRKRNLKWLWAVLAVAVIAAVMWLLLGHNGTSASGDAAPIDTAEVYVEEPVVTDTVTAQIVLTVLAEKHYGSPWFWVYIYEENKAIISDPNNIRPGTQVVIPSPEKYGIDPNDPASLKKAQRRSWEILTLGKR